MNSKVYSPNTNSACPAATAITCRPSTVNEIGADLVSRQVKRARLRVRCPRPPQNRPLLMPRTPIPPPLKADHCNPNRFRTVM